MRSRRDATWPRGFPVDGTAGRNQDMSIHATEHPTTCENTVSEGCGSCMATLIRSPRRTRPGSDCPGDQRSDSAGDHGQHVSADFGEGSDRRLVLLAVMAFVVPVVVGIVVVQTIESRAGSAAAAIAGLAAAGLTALTSALIVKRLTCRSTACGASR